MVAFMRKRTLNNKGVALVTVVLFFLVLVILLGGVMFSSISNQGNAKLSKDHTSAYYVAESGLNITIETLKDFLISNEYDKIPPGMYLDYINNLKIFMFDEINFPDGVMYGISPNGKYEINIVPDPTNLELFHVHSTGIVNSVSRTLVTDFKISKIEKPLMKAVIANNDVDNTNNGGGFIFGEVAILSENESTIVKLEGCDIGTVYADISVTVDTSCTTTKPLGTPKPILDDVAIKEALTQYNDTNLINVLNNGSNVFTFPPLLGSNVGYKIDKLPETNMTFDLGSESDGRVFELYVNNVDYAGNILGSINVIGDGELVLIIVVDSEDTKKISGTNGIFQWGWNVNNIPLLTNYTKFQLVVKKGFNFPQNVDPTFTTNNGTIFVGSILMDYVNMSIKGGNTEFSGFYTTLGKTIEAEAKVSIDGPMWIFAPNATVNAKTAYLAGAVMADSVYLTSNSTIKYEAYNEVPPFGIIIPVFEGGAMYPVGIDFEFINFKEV